MAHIYGLAFPTVSEGALCRCSVPLIGAYLDRIKGSEPRVFQSNTLPTEYKIGVILSTIMGVIVVVEKSCCLL